MTDLLDTNSIPSFVAPPLFHHKHRSFRLLTTLTLNDKDTINAGWSPSLWKLLSDFQITNSQTRDCKWTSEENKSQNQKENKSSILKIKRCCETTWEHIYVTYSSLNGMTNDDKIINFNAEPHFPFYVTDFFLNKKVMPSVHTLSEVASCHCHSNAHKHGI